MGNDHSTQDFSMGDLPGEDNRSPMVGPYKLLQKIGEGGFGDGLAWPNSMKPVRR